MQALRFTRVHCMYTVNRSLHGANNAGCCHHRDEESSEEGLSAMCLRVFTNEWVREECGCVREGSLSDLHPSVMSVSDSISLHPKDGLIAVLLARLVISTSRAPTAGRRGQPFRSRSPPIS